MKQNGKNSFTTAPSSVEVVNSGLVISLLTDT